MRLYFVDRPKNTEGVRTEWFANKVEALSAYRQTLQELGGKINGKVAWGYRDFEGSAKLLLIEALNRVPVENEKFPLEIVELTPVGSQVVK